MDPRLLIAPPSAAPYPTPFWFIELFKVLGFALHVWPMNLWYAGTIVAVLLGVLGKDNGRTVGKHIARALPFAIAFGVNFGIIPLLFVQVAYHQFFYPATILMAWPWFAVFWLVTVAYFGAYLYRLAIYDRGPVLLGKLGGWFAAFAFIVVGFIFANALSLMTNVGGWWSIFRGAETAGAATGAALNTGDPTLIPRWLFMFGLALTSTAAFIAIDAAFMSDRDGDDYKRYAGRFAFGLYTLGLLWFAGFGSWYIFGTRSVEWGMAMAHPVMKFVFLLTAVSPGLPWLLILFQWKQPKRALAALLGVAQFGVIALNAISRQWVQNIELGRFTDLAARPVSVQWSVLITFLLIFVFGVAVVAWMISKMVQVNRREAESA